MFYRLSQALLSAYFKVAYRHKIVGLEHVIEASDGCIIAANHTSFLDPPLIAASIPFPIHFLARASLFKGKATSTILRSLNAIPLTQQIDHTVFKMVGETKERGYTIVIFPEGTRSNEGEIVPFNLGVALLAKTLKCPVIPSYIDGAFKSWPKGRKTPKLLGKTLVAFAPPRYLKDFECSSKKEQYRAFTNAIENDIRELRNKYCNK